MGGAPAQDLRDLAFWEGCTRLLMGDAYQRTVWQQKIQPAAPAPPVVRIPAAIPRDGVHSLELPSSAAAEPYAPLAAYEFLVMSR